MAKAETKEHLACLAFAYFIKNNNYKNNPQHKEDWINLFKDFRVGNIEPIYKKYLEPEFKYSNLKSKYSYKNEEKPDDHLYAIYNQMITLFDSNLLNLTKKYRIYGQDSDFVKIVKNKCLERLYGIFSESFSKVAQAQDLTPADFYIVDSDQVNNIKKEFKKEIISPKNDTTLLLNYQKDKSKTYEQLIIKYFKSKELFPISHKMPEGKNPLTSIKLGGNISKVGNVNKKIIDPYSQLLVALYSKSPSEVEKIIDKVIDIKYEKWDIRENISSTTWELNFDFNYGKIDPHFDDAEFLLKPLPSSGSGSFNGMFSIVKGRQRGKSPWVAGMAPRSLEPFLRSYSGYNNIMRLLGKKRAQVFDDVIYKELLRTKRTKKAADAEMKRIRSKIPEYRRCMVLLMSPKFHTFNETSKKLSPFFIKIGQLSGFEEFQKEMIKKIRSEGGFTTDLSSIKPNQLYEHYISLQMSYFLFVGGRSFRQFLKKSIFFTIFGAITKRGFTKISGSGATNLVKRKVKDNKMMKEIEVSFTAAPHIILL
jgi:hypothetical protein